MFIFFHLQYVIGFCQGFEGPYKITEPKLKVMKSFTVLLISDSSYFVLLVLIAKDMQMNIFVTETTHFW